MTYIWRWLITGNILWKSQNLEIILMSFFWSAPSGLQNSSLIRDWTWATVVTSSPHGSVGKESTCQCRRCNKCRFDPWVGKIPWKRNWQLIPVFFPGEFHEQRSLAGYSPQSRRVQTWLKWWGTRWRCQVITAGPQGTPSRCLLRRGWLNKLWHKDDVTQLLKRMSETHMYDLEECSSYTDTIKANSEGNTFIMTSFS